MPKKNNIKIKEIIIEPINKLIRLIIMNFSKNNREFSIPYFMVEISISE